MTNDLPSVCTEMHTSPMEASNADRTEDQILAEVYQVMKRQQRAPPPEGYMFSKNDHVTTKMGKLPPLPCKCCSSSNHWDKECPDWAIYMESTSKSGYINEQSIVMDDEPYQSEYGILLSQRLASMQVDESKIRQDFEVATHCDQTNVTVSGCKSEERAVAAYTTTIEEVEDECWEEERKLPKANVHVLYSEADKESLDSDRLKEKPAPRKHPTKRTTISVRRSSSLDWKKDRN